MTIQIPSNARELILNMLQNQLHLNNTAYSAEWLEKGKTKEFHYSVAASQEIAEFINSYWLPWWSKAEQDLTNCKIEIVDALHFLLSEAIIIFDNDLESAADWIEQSLMYALTRMKMGSTPHTLEMARLLQASINADGEEVFLDLFVLSYSMNFTFEQLYALYMGKSVLNKFRQDHGYKQGLYKKKWDGVNEDNHFLANWISTQTSVTTEQIRDFLELEYAKYASA